jgi:SNF2 family DNA or RNA helicase
MGLGKTLSSIAVIAGHPSEDRKVKTTLVVAPLALLEQYVYHLRAVY